MDSEDKMDGGVDGQVDVDARAKTPGANGDTPSNGTVNSNGTSTEAAEAKTKPSTEPDPSAGVKPGEAADAEPDGEASAADAEKPEAEAEDSTEDASQQSGQGDELKRAEPAEVTAAAEDETKAEPEDSADSEAKDSSKAEGEEAKEAEAKDSADGGGDVPAEPPAASAGGTGGFGLPKSIRARVLSAVALVVVICLGVGGYLWYHNTHVPSDVAFRVYGQDVPITELQDEVQTAQAMYGIVPPTDGPKLAQFRKDFAKATAVSMVIEHAAAQRNIVVADRQVSDVLARYIAQVYGPGDDGHTKFVQDLANKGTSEPKVSAELKRQLTLTQLGQQITADVQVSDQEVQQYFDTHQAQLASPELRDLHNLVVASQADGDQIVAQIKAGANFEQLAQQDSLDTSTKAQGGELGLVSKDKLEPGYAEAAFSAPLSGVFGPVKTEHGYNVGKVVSIQPPAPAVFAQIKDQLRQELIQKKAFDKWAAFMAGEIKSADVVYNPDYRPADPNGLPRPPQLDDSDSAGAGQPAPGQPAPPK